MDVDIEGCKSLLNPEKNKYCVICNVHERRSRKTKCKNCACIFNSAPKAGAGSRIGMSANFKKYGIEEPSKLGKYQFFYFMYYPELNFELPSLPSIDLEGNDIRNKTFKWIIHHENGIHYDDRVWNLILMINTEHGVIHGEMNKINKPWEIIQESALNNKRR